MSYSRTYIPGEHLVTCDICGFEYRYSQMRKGVTDAQKGLNVGPICFEPKREYTFKPRPEGILQEIR